jgi:ribosome biogenesis GTPase
VRGKITQILSVVSVVDTAEGILKCAVRRKLVESDTGEKKPLAVGDDVEVERTGRGEGIITAVLPRRTKLSRTVPHDPRIEHVIVANVDRLLIVSAVRLPPLRVGLIDRYIIAAQTGGLEPVVCINKIDLAQSPADYEDVAAMYRRLGYRVLLTSAATGAGLEELRAVLKDVSTAFAGHSGVGKSSLLNALQPGLKLKTAPVDVRGRHCTSTATLLKLDSGGYVVDTPGVRELNLWNIKQRDVAEFYPEIRELAHDCRMPDCTHLHEQDCAVKAAVENGQLPKLRYESYVSLRRSLEELKEPRQTDVESPERQVPKIKRRPSRHTFKQQIQRRLREELG